jgi:hypothetical protein
LAKSDDLPWPLELRRIETSERIAAEPGHNQSKRLRHRGCSTVSAARSTRSCLALSGVGTLNHYVTVVLESITPAGKAAALKLAQRDDVRRCAKGSQRLDLGRDLARLPVDDPPQEGLLRHGPRCDPGVNARDRENASTFS